MTTTYTTSLVPTGGRRCETCRGFDLPNLAASSVPGDFTEYLSAEAVRFVLLTSGQDMLCYCQPRKLSDTICRMWKWKEALGSVAGATFQKTYCLFEQDLPTIRKFFEPSGDHGLLPALSSARFWRKVTWSNPGMPSAPPSTPPGPATSPEESECASPIMQQKRRTFLSIASWSLTASPGELRSAIGLSKGLLRLLEFLELEGTRTGRAKS